MSRRLFLKGLTGLFVAPAIVKAENLMKVIAPRTDIIMPEEFYLGKDDFTLEALIRSTRKRVMNEGVDNVMKMVQEMQLLATIPMIGLSPTTRSSISGDPILTNVRFFR